MPLFAGGAVCFTPQREPGCTDVLPGLQFFSYCLEQPPLQDHRPWWRAVEASFGSFSFDTGLSVPRHPPILSRPLCYPVCFFETREAARRRNPSLLWPRALCLTLAPKWKNVHSTTRAWWYRDLRSAVHWRPRDGSRPTLLSDYPSPWSLLKNHLLYTKVIDDTKTESACLSHQSTSTDIILCLGGQKYTRT